MQVITTVEVNVLISRANEFEKNFASGKQEPIPPGLLSSSLLRNSRNHETYKIQTVWESSEALEKMRKSTRTPKAIELFQKVNVEPTLEAFEIVDIIP
jgi:heme-degrading monooxygenase HmoA